MLEFEWDAAKAEANRSKHGVSFEEAATVFADSLSLTIPDPDHSDSEARWVTMGLSNERRLLVVVHTDAEDVIRIISARRASKNEQRFYEEG